MRVIAIICASVFAASPAIAGDPWPEGRDPRPLLKEVMTAYRSGDVSDVLRSKTTKVGRRVLGWLVEQKWFDERPTLIITEKKSQGARQELVGVYRFADGTEKVALVFFLEGGTLKFHDVFCFDMKGDRVDMFLSYILECPNQAAALFAIPEPRQDVARDIQRAAGHYQVVGAPTRRWFRS
jgi:hypothetical protein